MSVCEKHEHGNVRGGTVDLRGHLMLVTRLTNEALLIVERLRVAQGDGLHRRG